MENALLKAGDRAVYSNWGKKIKGAVCGHHCDPAILLFVPDSTEKGISPLFITTDGTYRDETKIVVTRIDETREAWDALSPSVRSALIMLGRNCGKKISAIQALRSLCPSLSLTEAKRAIENFPL